MASNIEIRSLEHHTSTFEKRERQPGQCGPISHKQQGHVTESSADEFNLCIHNCNFKSSDNVAHPEHEGPPTDQVDPHDLVLKHQIRSGTAHLTRISQYPACYLTDYETLTEKQSEVRKIQNNATRIYIQENRGSCLEHEYLNDRVRQSHEGCESVSGNYVAQPDNVCTNSITCTDAHQTSFEQGDTDLQSDDDDGVYVQH